METLKKNVTAFNRDVESNEGYRYTTNARFSSIVANRRLTKVTLKHIPRGVKTIIDIGCGDGTYTNDLFQARKDLLFEGTDPADKAIDMANSRYSEIHFFVSNILEPSSFPGRFYDMAVIRGVLHHLPEQAKAIANTKLLADYTLIIEPNGNNPIVKYIEQNSDYHIEHEEQSFGTKQLTQWCRDAGWEILAVEHVGFVPYFFPTLLSRFIYFFQPVLEKIPFLSYYLGGQIVILCKQKKNGQYTG